MAITSATFSLKASRSGFCSISNYITSQFYPLTADKSHLTILESLPYLHPGMRRLTSCTKVLILTLNVINKHILLSITGKSRVFSLRRQATLLFENPFGEREAALVLV